MTNRKRAHLVLAGLSCRGRHGAYPGERDVARTFLVDLDVYGAGPESTERIVTVTRATVAARSFALLERLAAEIGDAILATMPAVDILRVRVEKRDPPGLAAAAEAVTVSRARPSAARWPSAPYEQPDERRARG